MKTDNELIAEFLKLQSAKLYTIDDPFYLIDFLSVKPNWCIHQRMEFKISWDWLMYACKKWDELGTADPSMAENSYYIELCDKLDHLVTLYEIGPVFEQLVENIKWYNTQI